MVLSMLVEMGSVVENNILSDDVRAMVIQAPQVAEIGRAHV